MKSFIAILAVGLSLAGIATSQAADNHYALIIHGTLNTVVVSSGSLNDIVKVPITNESLIKPFVTGSNKAKDFDIVMDSVTAEIDIIKVPALATGTATVVAVLGSGTDTTATVSELHSTNPAHLGGLEVISGYLINLPAKFDSAQFGNDLPGPAITGMYLKLGVNKNDSSEFADVIAANFAGGYGEGQDNAYIISGVASTTKKLYTY